MMKNIYTIIISVSVLIILITASFFVNRAFNSPNVNMKYDKNSNKDINEILEKEVNPATETDTSDWEIYNGLGLSIKYPSDGDFFVDENGDYMTISQNSYGNIIHVSAINTMNIPSNFVGEKVINDKKFHKYYQEGASSPYGYEIYYGNKHYKFESSNGPDSKIFELIMKTLSFDFDNPERIVERIINELPEVSKRNEYSDLKPTDGYYIISSILSNKKDKVVYLELDPNDPVYDYNIWIKDLSSGKLIKIYSFSPSKTLNKEQSVKVITGGSSSNHYFPIAWSKNDEKIIIRWDYFGDLTGSGAVSKYKTYIVDTNGDNTIGLATNNAIFFDNYGKVVYVDEDMNGPSECGPASLLNRAMIVLKDIESSNEEVIVNNVHAYYNVQDLNINGNLLYNFRTVTVNKDNNCIILNDNEDTKVETTNINSLIKEPVVFFNWQHYMNEEYGVRFKYPDNLTIDSNNHIKSSNYEEKDGAGIISGFKIFYEMTKGLDPASSIESLSNWKGWAGRPMGSIGTKYFYEDIKINDNIALKFVIEGEGFMNEFEKTNTLITISIPNKLQDKMIEISMMTPSVEYNNNVKIFDKIMKTVEWFEK